MAHAMPLGAHPWRWSTISAPHRRFLVVDEMIGGAVVSFFVNVALGWIFFFWKPAVPLFGWSSIVADTIGMSIMLPMFTALGATIVVDRSVAHGKLAPLPGVRDSRWLRTAGWLRGTWVGVACAIVIVPALALVLHAMEIEKLTLWRFIWMKGAIAALIGLVVTPLLGWWALKDASRLAGRTPKTVTSKHAWVVRLRKELDPLGRVA